MKIHASFKKRSFRRALGLLTLFVSAFGVYAGSLKLLKVTYETIELKGLNEKLDGLKILHITDLHSNNPERMNVDIWKTIKQLDFDLVCITGDIVDRNAYQLEPHLQGLKELCVRAPVFFAEGNHDHKSMKRLMPYFDEAGVNVLVDEKAEYMYNGEYAEIIGVADFYTANLNVSAALLSSDEEKAADASSVLAGSGTKTGVRRGAEEEFNRGRLKIALVHQPQHIDYLNIDKGPVLVLSGHTHGGQIRLPFFPVLYAPSQGFFPKYGYGTYVVGDAKLFVSKGIGYTGKAPLRFWNRPEICLLTLKAV